jgi:chromosome segregation ATPase
MKAKKHQLKIGPGQRLLIHHRIGINSSPSNFREEVMETKDSYLEKMKAKFDDLNYKWNIERNKLEAKAQNAKVEVKKKFEEQLKTLQKRREKMSQKLDQIDVASEDAWRDIKEGVDNAWQSLNEAIKKARSHFD